MEEATYLTHFGSSCDGGASPRPAACLQAMQERALRTPKSSSNTTRWWNPSTAKNRLNPSPYATSSPTAKNRNLDIAGILSSPRVTSRATNCQRPTQPRPRQYSSTPPLRRPCWRASSPPGDVTDEIYRQAVTSAGYRLQGRHRRGTPPKTNIKHRD